MSRRWRWKSTVIDFSRLPDEYPEGRFGESRKEMIFRCLPLPDGEEREWKDGWQGPDYDEALEYAVEYGLAEWVDKEG